jgi:hypothetical protein
MTRNRDPDRRRPAPPHPGYAQFPLDIDTDVCWLCRALVPATEFARAKHAERDQKIEALLVMMATINVSSQLSDPAPGPPGAGSDQTSGAAVRPERTSPAPQGRVGRAAPDPTSEAGSSGASGDGARSPASDEPVPTHDADGGDALPSDHRGAGSDVRGDQLTEGSTAGEKSKSDDASDPNPARQRRPGSR